MRLPPIASPGAVLRCRLATGEAYDAEPAHAFARAALGTGRPHAMLKCAAVGRGAVRKVHKPLEVLRCGCDEFRALVSSSIAALAQPPPAGEHGQNWLSGNRACQPLPDRNHLTAHTAAVLKSFSNKALVAPWSSRSSRKIDGRLCERILRRLDRLDAATAVEQMDVPGFDFQPLRGKPRRHSVYVNGPWCLTFEFEGGDALRADLEQYH